MILNRGIVEQLFAVCLGMWIVQASLAAETLRSPETHWLALERDELHDPAMAELGLLQNPGEVLSRLPRDGAGNQVDWDKALEKGYIRPYANVRSKTQNNVLDLNVLRRNTGEMDMVSFPHKQHTEWLSCSNCHESLFKSKAGATKFGMFDILNGEYCGRCHGAVAFPLTECKRCHNVPRSPVALPAQAH